MSEGYTNRRKLTVDARDLDSAKDSIEKWARTLPMADVGFEFWSSANKNLPAVSTTAITFDKTLNGPNNKPINKESWVFDATGKLTVPKGKGGVYQLQFMIYLGAALAAGVPFVVAIQNIGASTSIAQQPIPAGASVDRFTVYGMARLKDGDVIGCAVNNASGGALTSTTYGGDTLTPPMPHFKGVRIALLD